MITGNGCNITDIASILASVDSKFREPSVKTLRSPLSAEFWRHFVLSSETQSDRTQNQSILQSHFVPQRRIIDRHVLSPMYRQQLITILLFICLFSVCSLYIQQIYSLNIYYLKITK